MMKNNDCIPNQKSYNDVISKLQHYIINDAFISKTKGFIRKQELERNKTFSATPKSTPTPTPISNQIPSIIQRQPSIFYPRDNDNLYWIFYIMKHGLIEYQYNNSNRFILEKKDKVSYIEDIKLHKPIIKMQKIMSLTDFENSMINERKINVNTFLNLCAIEKINVIFIKNKIYYELLMTDKTEIFVVSNVNSKYKDKYGIETCEKGSDRLNSIVSTVVQTNNIMNPIKSLSYYKLDDLIQMSNKFNLPTVCDTSKKNKKKADLYEQLVQYMS